MLGKEKCKILKEIRQRIADENDIPYVTRDCGYQGECKGSCPRCEAELRYLEQQLALRQSLGKRVAVAALCAGLALGSSACGPLDRIFGRTDDVAGLIEGPDDRPPIEVVTEGEVAPGDYTVEVDGDVCVSEEAPAEEADSDG